MEHVHLTGERIGAQRMHVKTIELAPKKILTVLEDHPILENKTSLVPFHYLNKNGYSNHVP
jgi:hypothetical protein